MKNKEKVKLILQDILDFIIKICEENNILYWLDSGTLLGAIRHKGFIPWDDDIDICMMKEDYEKFLKIFNDTEKYKLLEKNRDKDYEYLFAKVVSNKHFCEYNGTKNNKGIWIDIFPMDFYDISFKNYLNLLFELEQRKKIIRNRKKELKNKWKLVNYLVYKIKEKKVEKEYKNLIEKLEKNKNKGNRDIIEYNLQSFPVYKENRKYIDIFPLTKVLFEGKYYNCPNNYDSYLKVLYGDYMKLPEEKDRIGHLAGKYTFDIEDLNRILSKKD